jgi:signal transduction histidine kinase
VTAPAGLPAPAADVLDERAFVAVLAPTGRDAQMADMVLTRAGFTVRAFSDMPALCAALDGTGPSDSDVGVLLLAEAALGPAPRAALLNALAQQPSWSDLPVVLLVGEGALSHGVPAAAGALATDATVTLLERPVRVATLATTLQAALRARRRQLDVRAHLRERARAERTLRASEERERAARTEAETANAAKAQFLAMMSHELRTPLNAIGGYAQLLSLGLRGPVTPEQREDLDRIDRSQRHLLSLINDILNFARIEAGHVEMNMRPVPLAEVLTSVEPLVAPQLRAKAQRYGDDSATCKAVVLADPEKVRQVVLNLLSNAIKFTPPRGAISVACRVEGAVACVVVTDSGIGIPAPQLDAIFEPFVQVDRHFASLHQGTGLGLAISRDLARRMGGDITVASTPGVGTTFTLSLPLAPRPAQDADAPDAVAHRPNQ